MISESIRCQLKWVRSGSSDLEAAKLYADDTKLWAKVIQDAQISLD